MLRPIGRVNEGALQGASAKPRCLACPAFQRVLPIYCDPNGVINVDSLEAQQAFYMERGYLRYTTPLDVRGFLDDGPRAAAVARLGEFTKR